MIPGKATAEPTTTHIAAICTTFDRVSGQFCDLAVANATEITGTGSDGHEHTAYVMSDNIVYLADLPSAPLNADHHADLAIAEADTVLAAYGWTRLTDWGQVIDGVFYAELAPTVRQRTVTLVSVPAAGSPTVDGTDLADPETPVIVGLMTHPAVLDFIAGSRYRAGGHGDTRIHIVHGNYTIESHARLTVTLPIVPLTGRKLENLGLPEPDEWLEIDWGMMVFGGPNQMVGHADEHVTAAPDRMWLIDVPEDTRLRVPPGGEVAVPAGGYLITERGPRHASWLESTRHTRREAHAVFAQRGGFACPYCEMPLPDRPDITTCPRCTSCTPPRPARTGS